VLPAVLGCGGKEAASDEEAQPKDAHYTVPAASDLGESATYPVTTGVYWRVEGETATLRYRLPADLVGSENQRISMTGSWNAQTAVFDLAGTMGSAHCRTDQTSLHCEEKLPGIHVDLAAVERRVASAPDGAVRVEVSMRFITDPIGVLEAHYIER
jgi:hypothetical protein